MNYGNFPSQFLQYLCESTYDSISATFDQLFKTLDVTHINRCMPTSNYARDTNFDTMKFIHGMIGFV